MNKNLFFGLGFVLFTSLVLLINWLFNVPVNQVEIIGRQWIHTEKQQATLHSLQSEFLLHFEKEEDLGTVESDVRSVIGTLRKDIEAYRNTRVLSGNEASLAAVSMFSDALTRYENALNDFFLITRERGDENSGLIARWQEISNRLLQMNAPGNTIREKLNRIKVLEAGYLLHNNGRYLEDISLAAEDLRNDLSQIEDGAGVPDLDSYLVLTGNLLAVEKRFGSADSQGVIGEITTSFTTLGSASTAMNMRINEAVEKTTLRWTVLRYTTIFLFTAFCIVLLVFITRQGITNPLRLTALAMEKLASGDLSDNTFAQGLPEIIKIDAALVRTITGMKEKAEFARTLNEGNLSSVMNLLGEHDILGRELSQLQHKIRETAELQKRNDEATMKRRYVNEGLAKFADILRTRSNDISLLGDSFIREIVKYLGAIQGGFFMLNDSDPSAPVLELVSAFAYNRKKYMQKSLALGEGLVGTCAKEKQTINLTEIPEGYISITSGLGDTRPNNLLLLPVMHDNLLIGVLEIASLRTFMEHEIQFALEVGGSLGSTIIYTRNNERTSRLLEKSQQQALEMAEQEEEMRQNMEELKATQEESTRREEELRGIAEAISNTLLVIEYDLGGSIRQVNDRGCLFFGRTNEELAGKLHPDVFEGTLVPDEQFWNTVEKNNLTVVYEKVRIGKMEYPLKEHFTAVTNRDNLVVKYINFITPLSETYAP